MIFCDINNIDELNKWNQDFYKNLTKMEDVINNTVSEKLISTLEKLNTDIEKNSHNN